MIRIYGTPNMNLVMAVTDLKGKTRPKLVLTFDENGMYYAKDDEFREDVIKRISLKFKCERVDSVNDIPADDFAESLKLKSLEELQAIGKELKVNRYHLFKEDKLIEKIVEKMLENKEEVGEK